MYKFCFVWFDNFHPTNIFFFYLFSECTLEYVLETASLHPARALGIDNRKGKLNYGFDADFVLLDPKTLKVMSTWIAGECVYRHA